MAIEPIADKSDHARLCFNVAELVQEYLQGWGVDLNVVYTNGEPGHFRLTHLKRYGRLPARELERAKDALIKCAGEDYVRAQTLKYSLGDANGFMEALSHSPDAKFLREFLKIYRGAWLRDQAHQSAAVSGASEHAHHFANLVTDRVNKGAYFDVGQLCAYYAPFCDRNRTLGHFGHFHTGSQSKAYADTMQGEDNLLARKVVQRIRDYGFNRLRFLGKGGWSLVLASPPNAEGKEQVVVVSTPEHVFVPHPTILPAKAYDRVKGHEHSMQVRVMPLLDTKDVTDGDVAFMERMAKKSGLELVTGDAGHEIRKDNIGILRYTKPDGTPVRLPYFIDWAVYKPASPRRFLDLQAQWKADGDLKPYYEAMEYLKKQAGLKDLLPEAKELRAFFHTHGIYDRGDPERLVLLSELYQDRLLTPQELKAVADKTDTLLAKQKTPPTIEEMRYVANRLAADFDTSLPHNAPGELPPPPSAAGGVLGNIVAAVAALFRGRGGSTPNPRA